MTTHGHGHKPPGHPTLPSVAAHDAPTFEAVLVDRTPHEHTAVTLTEIDAIVGATGLSWTETINGSDHATLSFDPDRQSTDVKKRLRDPKQWPTEIWIRRNERIVSAGPFKALQMQGATITVNVKGLFSYLGGLYVDTTAKLEYTNKDQLEIAKALIDYAQGKGWSHYGLDTSDMTSHPSGQHRTRVYDGTEAAHRISDRVTELGAITNGFDIRLDPHTRKVIVGHPHIGEDKSATIIIDRRNIWNPNAVLAITDGDYANKVYAWSQNEGGTLAAGKSDNPGMHTHGRVETVATFRDITDQATIDHYTAAHLAARTDALYRPSPQILPIGFDVPSFGPGDTIHYSYDHGLGLFDTDLRIQSRTITVNDDGTELITLKPI